MNKLKIAVAALIIAAGTFGAFAFSDANNVEPVTEEAPTIYWYGNQGNGIYVQLSGQPNPLNCQNPDNFPCTISSEEDLAGFEYDDRPADAEESPENRVYTGI